MSDLLPWIRLTKSGVRPLRLQTLLQHFGSPQAILSATAEQLMEASGIAPPAAERILSMAKDPCATDLAAMSRLHVELLPWGDARYPALLREIADPPCALYVRGALTPEDRTAVAVVGTRSASPYGRDVSAMLGRELARAGVTVVSGLAVGVDTCAHRGALAAGGRTLAVLGSGVDFPYPAGNARLREEIVVRGALISEYPMGSGPESWRFPARNRIVSGLSLGTVVVEGGPRSGALITADFAAEQGRDVFAVPGDIRTRGAEGPHGLLRDGARLVHRVEDILHELRIVSPPNPAALLAGLTEIDLSAEAARVLDVLSLQQRHVDEIIAESGLTAAQVGSSLMILELKGLIRKLPGNGYVRLPRGGTA